MRLAQLQQALHKVTPAAVLVSHPVMDRVIQQVWNLPLVLWEVPHRKSYVVDRQVLFRHIEQDDLDLNPDHLLPPKVILLCRPSAERLASNSDAEILEEFWRRLFHASIHLELEGGAARGELPLEAIRSRIEAIGPHQFKEACQVLVQEHLLIHPQASSASAGTQAPSASAENEQQQYIEFAAVFLELHFFAANLLSIYFPSIDDPDRVVGVLCRDFDAVTLFERTRLEGTPNPVLKTDTRSDESHDFFHKLIRQSDRAAEQNNLVRAAILRTRAARVAPASATESTRAIARADMERLATRLQMALELPPADIPDWTRDLERLLDKADQGSQPVEAGLLFELQNVCLDHEQNVYTLSLVDWALSGGRRPIQRPLPSQRLVRIIKHLRSASQRLTMARLSDADRQHLDRLLHTALEASEERLRARFRPLLEVALLDVGLEPANPPETIAFQNVIEEILDRINGQGFLTFSDLRDTLSRNQLKLPDLSDPRDLVRGDPLLRLDRRLSTVLDGVYRPSEFYMRLLEWLSALGFGTPLGRLLTSFVLLPFGGGFVLWEGLKVLWGLLGPGAHYHVPGSPAHVEIPSVLDYGVVLLIGLFLLGVMHWPALRTRCRHGLSLLGEGFLEVLLVWPGQLMRQPWLVRIFLSWPYQFFHWCLLRPLVVCLVLWLVARELFASVPVAITTFVAVAFLVNSQVGRGVAEVLNQAFADFFELLKGGLIPGLYRLIVSFFGRLRDGVEQVFFSVDEWLRFRSGDSQLLLVVRMVLSTLWYPISWLARFYMHVLIEPGINPLKFPISSIAAKFILPFAPLVIPSMAALLIPVLGASLGQGIAWVTFIFLPDAFGFLFWELKENWSLYQANRPRLLTPLAIGFHGETLRGLLQPGFHSGTIPRLYARLRKAVTQATRTGDWRTARTYWHTLAEIQRSLLLFVMRNLVALLKESQAWQGQDVQVGAVKTACNQIQIELRHGSHAEQAVWLEIESDEGWLLAGIRSPGWLPLLTPAQLQSFNTALANLYKLAGIDLVREQIQQIQSRFHHTFAAYDVRANALILWLDHRHGRSLTYYWHDEKGFLKPQVDPLPALTAEIPALEVNQLVFGRMPVFWQHVVECWQRYQTGSDTSGRPKLDVVDVITPTVTTGEPALPRLDVPSDGRFKQGPSQGVVVQKG